MHKVCDQDNTCVCRTMLPKEHQVKEQEKTETIKFQAKQEKLQFCPDWDSKFIQRSNVLLKLFFPPGSGYTQEMGPNIYTNLVLL